MLAELSPGASSASTVFGKSKKVTYLVLGEQSIADTSYQHHGNEKRDGGSDDHVAEVSRMARELVGGIGGGAESYSITISRIYGYSIRQIYIIEKPGGVPEVDELRGCGC